MVSFSEKEPTTAIVIIRISLKMFLMRQFLNSRAKMKVVADWTSNWVHDDYGTLLDKLRNKVLSSSDRKALRKNKAIMQKTWNRKLDISQNINSLLRNFLANDFSDLLKGQNCHFYLDRICLEIFGFSQIDIDSLVLKNGLGGGFSKIGDVKACVSTAAFEWVTVPSSWSMPFPS